MKKSQKLSAWAEKEVPNHLDRMIIEENGIFFAFGRYVLKPSKGHCDVFDLDEHVKTFSSKRVAISWCVAHRLNLVEMAQEISNLDHTQRLLAQDITVRRALSERTARTEKKQIIQDKIASKAALHQGATKRLDNLISRAKYLQLRGFQNETARTRRV
jgi:hypothetical protein